MAATLTRPFTALNGMEVKTAILAEIKRQLDADTRFSVHLAYARIEWRWKMATDCYPAELGRISIELGGTIAPKDARQIEVGEVPEKIDFQGGTTVAAPVAGVTADQVRREAGLPVPSPRTITGPGGSRISVDAPEVPRPSRESDEMGDAPHVQINVPTSKGVVARSTTLRTRAAPKGTAPVERVGSPPTAEDAEKIIERGLEDGTLEERKEE